MHDRQIGPSDAELATGDCLSVHENALGLRPADVVRVQSEGLHPTAREPSGCPPGLLASLVSVYPDPPRQGSTTVSGRILQISQDSAGSALGPIQIGCGILIELIKSFN